MIIPNSIKKFIDSFSRLPSVGPRMANRLSFHMVNMNEDELEDLITAMNGLKNLDKCPVCFFIKEKSEKLCPICSNKNRDKKIVLIVEKESNLISVEKSKSFNGIYLVIGESGARGNLSDEQIKRLDHLKSMVKQKNTELDEIIVALNQTTEGDLLFQSIKKRVKEITKKVSKLGRGLPTGGEIEFADEETLSNALNSRN